MTDHHDRFVFAMPLQQAAKLRERCRRTQRRVHHDFAFVAHLVSHQGRRLRRALERAAHNQFDLHLKSGQGAANVAALLNPFAVEPALFVCLRILQARTSAGMPHKINDHE